MVGGCQLATGSIVERLSGDTVVGSVGIFAKAIEVARHELDIAGYVLALVYSIEGAVVVNGLLIGRDLLELNHIIRLLVVGTDLLEIGLVGLITLLDELEHTFVVLLDDVIGGRLSHSCDPRIQMSVDVLDDTSYLIGVISAEIADDQVVFLIDQATVCHLLGEVFLIDLADTYDPLLGIHTVLSGEEAWSHGQKFLLDLQIIGLCTILFVEIVEAFHFTDGGLCHLEEFVGLHEADVYLDSLAVAGNNPEGGEGFDLVLFRDLDVLGSFCVELEIDKLGVEEGAHFRLSEDSLLHLLTGDAPRGIEIHEEWFALALSFCLCFGERTLEETDASSLLCGADRKRQERYDHEGHILEISHRERVLFFVLDDEGEEATELTAVALVVDP